MSDDAEKLRERFSRRWVCEVAQSAFHNGAGCNPSDPHSPSWHCGWYWEARIADRNAARYGLGVSEDNQ